jgi:multiple sugar transport system ATP-binding protein
MADIFIQNLSKQFGATPVLKGIDLEIKQGEFLTLVGPSGCGKSTLLRILAGLERQSAGRVAIGNRPVDGIRPKDRDVAMVFQSYALYPHLSVFDNMAVPLRMRKTRFHQRLPLIGRWLPGSRAIAQDIAEQVKSVAGILDIEHLLERKPAQLSGGQRQRIALGRAMVRHPHVFLMDEPLSNLDAKLRVHMRAEIAQLHRRLGVTFIYVTHDQAEAMTMSDRVAVLMEGELLQVAPPTELYTDPRDLRVAEFIGSPKINVFPARVHGDGGVQVGDRLLPLRVAAPPDRAIRLGVRPERLQISRPGEGDLTAQVHHLEHLGSDLFLHLTAPDWSSPVIARVNPERHYRLGESVGLRLPAEQTLVFDATGKRLAADWPNAFQPNRLAHG